MAQPVAPAPLSTSHIFLGTRHNDANGNGNLKYQAISQPLWVSSRNWICAWLWICMCNTHSIPGNWI